MEENLLVSVGVEWGAKQKFKSVQTEEQGPLFRALRDHVFSIGTGTGNISNLVPSMRPGPGILYPESHCWDRDRD